MSRNRPYSMTGIGFPYCAIVKWTGSGCEIVSIYKRYKRDEEKIRAKCVALNDAHERTNTEL